MKTKTWVVLFPIISLSLLILVIGFNYVVDPYGFNNKFRIHHINANKTQTDSQSRKFKLGLIEDRKIEGIFLGSSEMTFLGNTDYMQKITGIKYFNFAFNEQEIYESYKYLEYILKNNKVKQVVFGVHLLKFNKDGINYRQDKPSNILGEKFNIKYYISHTMLIDSLKTLYKNINNYPQIYNSSGWKIVDRAQYYKIEKSNIKEWTKMKVGESPHFFDASSKNFSLDTEKIRYLYQIIDLCKKNNINLKLLFTPMYYKHFTMMHSNIDADFSNLKRLIVQAHPFHDFMQINKVNLDYMNFIDSVSHPNKKISYLLIDALNMPNTDKKFGELINSNNIETHIKQVDDSIHRLDQ